jgi:transcriptional regulator with XRE-family HTH domain
MRVRVRVRDIAQDSKHRWSKGKLARKSDLTPRAVSEIWDDPYHNANLYTLVKLADALGVPFCELFEEEEEDAPPPDQ